MKTIDSIRQYAILKQASKQARTKNISKGGSHLILSLIEDWRFNVRLGGLYG